MKPRRTSPGALVRTAIPRGQLLLCALALLLLTATARAQEETCPDGTSPHDARPIATPLPALDVLSAGCEELSQPAVRFLVGHDGQTYYIEFETSTGCPTADEELGRWINCWTYEPARCGAEPKLQLVSVEVQWPASGATVLPCQRDHEVTPQAEEEAP